MRILNGKEIIKIFTKYGAQIIRQKGSHVRLSVQLIDIKYITIPLHDPVKRGTLSGIIKDFQECFGIEKTLKEFYK